MDWKQPIRRREAAAGEAPDVNPTDTDTERWAACDTCQRSFFVPEDADAADVACPVCAEPPARLERRAGDTVLAVEPGAPDARI